MKNLIILFTVFLAFKGNCQQPGNHFKGYFENSSSESLYRSFHFDGKGHVFINDSLPADFVRVNDKLLVAAVNTFYIFSVTTDKIIHIDSFGNKLDYVKKAKNTVAFPFETYEVNPELLFEYFSMEYDPETLEPQFLLFTDRERYLEKTKSLCKRGLTSACEAFYGAQYMADALEAFAQDKELKVKPNPEIPEICTILRKYDPGKAYFLLAVYYAAINDKETALQNFVLAKKEGSPVIRHQLHEIEKFTK